MSCLSAKVTDRLPIADGSKTAIIAPVEIGRLLERVKQLAEGDERVVAALLYGSHAGGTADEHSDVDIGFIVTDAAHADFVASRDELVRSLGEPLFADDFGKPGWVHVIFADGMACELIIGRESELHLARPYRILLDKTGAVERALHRDVAPAAAADAETVRRLVTWFWHDVEHVVTALARGQTLWAAGGLDELRRVCLQLARISSGAEVEAEDPYWKADAALAPAHAQLLRETIVPAEIAPMHKAARALVMFYRELAQELAAAHGLAYPAELDRLVSSRLE